MFARFLVLAAVGLTATAATAQPPAGADLVPTNGFAFATLKVSDLWDSEHLKDAREAILKGDPRMLAGAEKAFGISPAEVERVTVFWPVMLGNETPFLVITTRKTFNEAKVLKSLGAMPLSALMGLGRQEPFDRLAVPLPKAASPVPFPKEPDIIKKEDDPCAPQGDKPVDSPTGDLFFLRDHRPFEVVYLVDDRTLLFMPLEDRGGVGLVALVASLLKKKTDGPLAAALAASSKHTFAAGMKVPATQLLDQGFPPQLVPFRSLAKARVVAMTADLGPTAKLMTTLTFADAEAARRAEPVLKTLIQTGEEQLAKVRKELAADADYAAVLAPLMELATKSLAKVDVKTDGVTLTAALDAEIGPAVAKAVAAAPQLLNAASERTRTLNNLKQIGLAIHNYHDTMGTMPQDVLDKTGKPILSWRVQILPYLEQDNLFRQIDMTKPWDDPANQQFHEKMPDVFRVYGRDTKAKGLTYLQMPSADKPIQPFGNPFKVPGVRRNLATITDGTSNTLMVVEAEEAVQWMKPDDVKLDAKTLPKLGAPARGSFVALFGDGSVKQFDRKRLDDATLRALLTVDGGEVVNIDR